MDYLKLWNEILKNVQIKSRPNIDNLELYFSLKHELQDRKCNTKMNMYLNFNTIDISVAKILHRPTLQTLLFVFL